jgi:uncharacterized protein (DUF3820 family)
MLKKTRFRLLCLAAMVSILFIAQAQTEEQGWKMTISLPSGEVVCDLNGEWDYLLMGRGEGLPIGRIGDVVKITQQGDSFEGIRMIGSIGNWGHGGGNKGSKAIEGELDKNGFKKLLFYAGGDYIGSYNGKISKEENLIEFNIGWAFIELTRK